MQKGISGKGLQRIAQGVEFDDAEYGPPDEQERRDYTSPFYDEAYDTETKERNLQEDIESTYKSFVYNASEVIGGESIEIQQGILRRIIENPELFAQHMMEELRLMR